MSARSDLATHLATELAASWPELTVYDHTPDVFSVPCLMMHRTGCVGRTINGPAVLEWDIDLYIITQRAIPGEVADTQDDLFMDIAVALQASGAENVRWGGLGPVEFLDVNETVYAQSVVPLKVKE